MSRNLVDELRDLPELQPPPALWGDIVMAAQLQRSRRMPMAWAATVLVLMGLGWWVFNKPAAEQPLLVSPVPVEPAPALLEPDHHGADVGKPESVGPIAANPQPNQIPNDIARLQRRSQHMERLLGQLPPRSGIIRADSEGLIVELQDRIAAVDHQLNEAAWGRAYPVTAGRNDSSPTLVRDRLYDEAAAPVLWRQRVELMDELVRARYIEADATGF